MATRAAPTATRAPTTTLDEQSAAAATTTPATSSSATRVPPKKQDFVMYCHNVTLADGTLLDNDAPAPDFVVQTLEERTGITRPPNADRCSLSELKLFFSSGGVCVPK